MIVRRRTMRRLSLNKCLVQGRWPDADCGNQVGVRTDGSEQKYSDSINRSERKALPIDNRGPYKSYTAPPSIGEN